MHSSINHTETPLSPHTVSLGPGGPVNGAAVKLAYQTGRIARDERRISPNEHWLYERLVYMAKRTGFAWAGERMLAGLMDVGQRTIRRWIADLVAAGLIVRRRRMGTPTLTYIVSWLPPDDLPDDDAEDDPGLSVRSLWPHGEATDPPPDVVPVAPLIFIKQIDLKPGGGGAASISDPVLVTADEPEPSPPAAAVELLTTAGLEDPPTIRRLASYPIERIREVIGQVKRQRATPGLVQHKLDHGVSRARVRDEGFSPRSKGGHGPPVPKVEDYLDGYCAGCGFVTHGNCPCWIGPMPEGQT